MNPLTELNTLILAAADLWQLDLCYREGDIHDIDPDDELDDDRTGNREEWYQAARNALAAKVVAAADPLIEVYITEWEEGREDWVWRVLKENHPGFDPE